MGNIKDKVAIVGMGCSKFGENWDKSAGDLIIDAVYEALADAKIGLDDIQAGWLSTHLGGYGGSLLSETLQWDLKPITRVETNCASAADALRNAAFAVACGMYDTVLVVAVEKCKDTGVGALTWSQALHPILGYTSGPAGFAIAALAYFQKYGLSINDGKRTIGKIAVKNHHNGSMHPKAHFQREITLEQVLNAPIVAWPLGLFDCCGTTDGAAAAVITRADLAKKFRDDYVLIKGSGYSVGRRDPFGGKTRPREDYDYTIWPETVEAARQAYTQAGVKDPRKEIRIANVHDCFTITELIIYESLGFSPKGKGKEDVDSGFFTIEGGLSVNTDGGLKAFGHPIGASGLRMVYEIYKQIQGKAGPRQIKNPGLGLAHSQGGNPTAGFQSIVTILGPRD